MMIDIQFVYDCYDVTTHEGSVFGSLADLIVCDRVKCLRQKETHNT